MTIESIQHAFELGKQMRRDEIKRNIRHGWPSQRVNMTANNLHLNGGGLPKLKHDAAWLCLRECGGNLAQAAKKLKVGRTTFYGLLK
jgi:transcriptional regulator of acetoin/glycerol metabolism